MSCSRELLRDYSCPGIAASAVLRDMHNHIENNLKCVVSRIRNFKEIINELKTAKSEVDIEALEFEAELMVESIAKAIKKLQYRSQNVDWHMVSGLLIVIGHSEHDTQQAVDSIKAELNRNLDFYTRSWNVEKTKRYWMARLVERRHQMKMAEPEKENPHCKKDSQGEELN